MVRSQTQALSQVAGGLSKMANALASWHARQLDTDKARDKEFLEFKSKENEENSHGELEIAKIFSNAMMRSTPAFIPNMNTQVMPQWSYAQSLNAQKYSAHNSAQCDPK